MANWDPDVLSAYTSNTTLCGLWAARINGFYKHTVLINGKAIAHLLVSLSWFKSHPQHLAFGKPVIIWYYDLFEYCGLVPVQLIVGRTVSLIDKHNSESVLFVVPCIE